MKTVKRQVEEKTYEITFPWGETITIGPGISNVPTTHKGVPAKDFSKALAKAAKEASEAGIYDKKEDYGIYIPVPTK
jgi:hypothetical protein